MKTQKQGYTMTLNGQETNFTSSVDGGTKTGSQQTHI